MRRACSLIAVTIALVGAVGCSEPEATPSPTSAPATMTPEGPPTRVSRIEPTPTPTVDPAENPMFPVESEVLTGVPVPIAAELVEFSPATEGSDARAEYALDDFDEDMLYEWYQEHMPAFGWNEEEDRDGSLVFLHDRQLSQRFADEGLRRTATLLFVSLTDEGDFTLISELPEGREPVSSDEDGESSTEEDAESDDDEATADDGEADDTESEGNTAEDSTGAGDDAATSSDEDDADETP